MLNVLSLSVGVMKCKCYVVYDTDYNEALIIDAGDDAEFIKSQLNKVCDNPKAVISTHGHFDHNMAVFELQTAFNIPYLISEKDLFLLKTIQKSAKHFTGVNRVLIPKASKYLKDGQKIEIADSFFEVIGLPGHTPGGIGLYNPVEGIAFVGDILFKHGLIGRYDFSYSSKKCLMESIDKILSLPEKTIIYPGHGEPTDVKSEKYNY